MSLVETVQQWSSDDSTQVGCAVRGQFNEVLSMGYNGLPRGIAYSEERMVRPEKYKWFEHAERNAIYNAANTGTCLRGSSFYISMLPCADCARGIVQVGALEVVVPSFEVPERWRKSMISAVTILREGYVRVRRVNDSSRTLKHIIKAMEGK
jgi:dCMP deaminase